MWFALVLQYHANMIFIAIMSHSRWSVMRLEMRVRTRTAHCQAQYIRLYTLQCQPHWKAHRSLPTMTCWLALRKWFSHLFMHILFLWWDSSNVIITESMGANISKFTHAGKQCNNFPWMTLLNFFASHGLIMTGWPDSVLMPGQLRHQGAKMKGVVDLTNADW